ncbi:HNH endonuclease [Micromonospora sp. NPDC048999]|uniref:HNH endonuclease n=1 Tax=Micromonospora sp. NPDC048999 TaxID=3155391 RepID=UPI0033C726FD
MDHLCRDRACVNPAHLELVTRTENLRRRDHFGKPLGHLPLADRLLARRLVDGEGCWIWTGAKVRGYGVLSVAGRTRYVHRVAYELAGGTLGGDLTLDHPCQKPACFNSDHLEAVSRPENSKRAATSSRRRRTCRNGHVRQKVGVNSDGTCAGCHPDRRRKGPPRRGDVHIRCAKGHSYAETGRYPSGGCIACQKVKDKGRRKGPRPPLQHCPRGHDTFQVGRSRSNGECRECARQYARTRYGYRRTAAELVTRCRNGHVRTDENTRIVSRTRNDQQRTERLCLDCRREAVARHEQRRARHRAGDGRPSANSRH